MSQIVLPESLDTITLRIRLRTLDFITEQTLNKPLKQTFYSIVNVRSTESEGSLVEDDEDDDE